MVAKIEDRRIIDLYQNDEIILRIHNDLDNQVAYEEIKIFVEDNGVFTERIRVMGKVKRLNHVVEKRK